VFIRRDLPTLEWEVASYPDPCPWPEGREEPAMDRMCTIVVKPKCGEQKSPFLARQMSKLFYDTSIGTATRAAHYGSLLEGLRLSYM
jgi:hypothetical protein